ncbi:hypothetical protein GCM10010052_20100 [Paenarthrobacter histidinolovorans]|nr:hypothetical protein GCM10010052_20100 [Paenarthrobacter histidinolovorans]
MASTAATTEDLATEADMSREAMMETRTIPVEAAPHTGSQRLRIRSLESALHKPEPYKLDASDNDRRVWSGVGGTLLPVDDHELMTTSVAHV